MLYGYTSTGGDNSKGIVFKISKTGNVFSKILDFANCTLCGFQPLGGSPLMVTVPQIITGLEPVPQTITGLEPEPSQVSVYPNPVETTLYINLPESQSEKNILIFNTTGGIIGTAETSQKEITLDVAQYPTGLYLIRVSHGKMSETKKFVKK
jgi:uncharacterized repeat protein (TIGR03803 family)